jgi:hypothetical protein
MLQRRQVRHHRPNFAGYLLLGWPDHVGLLFLDQTGWLSRVNMFTFVINNGCGTTSERWLIGGINKSLRIHQSSYRVSRSVIEFPLTAWNHAEHTKFGRK